MASPQRSSPPYYVVAVLLAIALGVFAVLLFLLTVKPAVTMSVAVGNQTPTECPVGSGAPACFRFDVTNTGARDGVASCVTTPTGATSAQFANGSRTAEVLLSAGEVKQVYVKVVPIEGGDEVFAPLLVCRPG